MERVRFQGKSDEQADKSKSKGNRKSHKKQVRIQAFS
jgi:hypothetical protein